MRSKTGIATYTLRLLAEALQKRQRYIVGSRIVLIGFTGHTDEHARKECEEIVSTLKRNGAEVHSLDASFDNYADFRIQLTNVLRHADAALIDTDSRFFKALRPKEVRALGVNIVIPTSLRA